MTLIGIISFFIGREKFDSSNAKKSYEMLNRLLNDEIELLEFKLIGEVKLDQEASPSSANEEKKLGASIAGGINKLGSYFKNRKATSML